MSTEQGKPAIISGDDIKKERSLRFLASSCVTSDSAMQKLRRAYGGARR